MRGCACCEDRLDNERWYDRFGYYSAFLGGVGVRAGCVHCLVVIEADLCVLKDAELTCVCYRVQS